MSGPLLSAGFWLHHAALTWRAELDARLRPLGLTPTQFLLLASAGRLDHESGPPAQREVAEYAGADRMMTSKVLRALEERGLLARAAHESDARSVRVTLTSEGRELTRRAIAIAQELDVEFFGGDSATLRGTLREVAERRRDQRHPA